MKNPFDTDQIDEYTLLVDVERDILVVDMESSIRTLLSEVLQPLGSNILLEKNATDAVRRLKRQDVSLLICDLNLPDFQSSDVINVCQKNYPETQIIVTTGFANVDAAVSVLREGIFDYLLKPFEDLDVLVEKTKRALELNRLLKETRALSEYLKETNRDLSLAKKATEDAEAEVENSRALYQATVLGKQGHKTRAPETLGKNLRSVVALLARAQVDDQPLEWVAQAREKLKAIVKDLDRKLS